MTLNELIKEAQKWADRGYGEKPIFTCPVVTENGDIDLEIEGIASDTSPGYEPNFLFIMAGEKAEIKIREEIK